MKAPLPSVVLVTLAGLLLRIWAAYGPFLIYPGPFHWSVTPGYRTVAFATYLLWLPLLALTYRRDPGGRIWKLLLVYFATDATWVLGFFESSLTWTLCQVLAALGPVVLLHLVLGFPTGRLPDRFDRWLLGTMYVIVLPLQVLRFMVWDPGIVCAPTDAWCPSNVLLVVRNDDLASMLGQVGLLSPLFAALAIVEVLRHWRGATPAGRRVLAPVAFGEPFMAAIYGFWWLLPAIGRTDLQDVVYRYFLLDIPAAVTPILFLVGLLRTRLARGDVAALARELGAGIPLGGLRDTLARALHDPTLQLAFPAAEGSGLVDHAGQPFSPTPGRAVSQISRDGQLAAVLVHDRAIDVEDPELVEAVSSVAGLALDNERLAAQVRAQLAEVQASRQRIVEAADAERRRVERDLHDGAQQRLVALTMRLEAARGAVPGASDLIDQATDELRAAVGEVRDLARGLHPPILAEAGLAAALEALAERSPVPVTVDAPADRFPQPVESTAYFVVAEALANAAKYARASQVRVQIQAAGDRLTVRVEDDGAGGADPDGGSGLRGLVDRVSALGGTFAVDSPPGGGTSLTALLPT